VRSGHNMCWEVGKVSACRFYSGMRTYKCAYIYICIYIYIYIISGQIGIVHESE